ncbi:MAG: hypothetical protein CME02_10330 [Geminicoccus sp.]|nr:hypothetical protein [Geminicoccus sp.]
MDQCSLKMEHDQVWVEFQGSEAFAVEHLIPVLAKIDWKERVSDIGSSSERNLAIRTTHATCMRIGHMSSADLFLSAVAKLSLIDGVTRFSRNQLHHEAKSAREIYKRSTHGNNASAHIRSLRDSGRLVLVDDDIFELSDGASADLEVRLFDQATDDRSGSSNMSYAA